MGLKYFTKTELDAKFKPLLEAITVATHADAVDDLEYIYNYLEAIRWDVYDALDKLGSKPD
jgi:hypothetical protein